MQTPVVIGLANAVLLAGGSAVSVLAARGGQSVVCRGTVNGTASAIKFYATLPYEMRVGREVDVLKKVSCPAITAFLWAGTVRIAAVVFDAPVAWVATLIRRRLPRLARRGEPWFMSPKQSRRVKQLKCRSDLFAIGLSAAV